ncbi:MAG: ABC transporter substrate-binding protein, partial [Leptospiraceae bacterium]|nr:ABC transporter substrate-binding protein [Leptospiraceae bacterium]
LTQVPHKRVTYNVDFKLFRKGGTLRLYDVVIDGSSTLLDFRNQFSAIIQKKGVNYLISRLKTRMKELEKEQEDRLSGQNED